MGDDEHLQVLLQIRDQLSTLNGERKLDREMFPAGDPPMPTLQCLTNADVELQKQYFDQFDDKHDGKLAQMEVRRMLKATNLFDSVDELIQVLKEMDEDDSGTIEFDEYIAFLDKKCAADPVFLDSYRTRVMVTKLGFDGTTWRPHANISWLTNQGIMILTCLAIVAALVYFSFMLVPLTMAYFLTFLFGPIMDVLVQRPFLCSNAVCCDKSCIRPAKEQDCNCCGKQMKWDPDGTPASERKYMTPRERMTLLTVNPDFGGEQWNDAAGRLNWEEDTGCCYATPPKSCEAGGLRNPIWALFNLAKIPDALSVAAALLIVGLVLGATTVVVAAEFQAIADDPDFSVKIVNAQIDFNRYLKTNHTIEIAELAVMNETVVTKYTTADILAESAPIIYFVNNLILTLLLCLYMLLTRVAPVEEEVYKDPQRFSLFEKIKSKIEFYVVLKTALSALTGGLVTVTLYGLGVRLATVFGLLSMLLNFIPNVGSLIAMVLPLPIIWLDDSLDDHTQWMATLIPMLIQGYVGNFLEPAVFGSSLNVTALSVLAALVFWGSIWGLQGAVLSVPLLAAMKIGLEEADYPLAKMMLRLVRENSSVDDRVESKKTRSLSSMVPDFELKGNGSSSGLQNNLMNDDETENPVADDMEEGNGSAFEKE